MLVLMSVAADRSHEMAERRSIVLLGVACVGLVAGCGGAASSTPKYVAAANAICTEQLAQLGRLPQPTTPEQAVSYLPRALAIMRRETTGLASLDPVGSGRAQLAAALADTQQLAAVLRRFLDQLQAGIVEINTLSQVQTQANELRSQIDTHFRQAGLARCAE
jgi:uncharacterized protein involved in exopolysaccharide biosynthesis